MSILPMNYFSKVNFSDLLKKCEKNPQKVLLFDQVRTSKKNTTFMIGQKIREYRESKGLLQRQMAAALEVDTAYISRIESNEKPLSKNHLKKISALLEIPEEEITTIWLADRIISIIEEEKYQVNALKLALTQLDHEKL